MTSASPPSLDRWASVQRGLGARLGQSLFDDISKTPLTPSALAGPKLSWSLALAYALATSIYLASAGIGIAGVALLAPPWDNKLMIMCGAMLVMLCIASRPRPSTPPEYLLDRTEYPTLYALCERMAKRLGAAPVDGIAMSADFGANYRVAGWRRQRYIELGAPLMAILSPEERIAVMAHELSHGANGDPLRGTFLSGAVNTLVTWAIALRPGSIGRLGEGMPLGVVVTLLGIPLELSLLAASEFLLLAARALLLLVLRQSQRAEYLADLLAATVAGTSEMQAALEKTYCFEVVGAAIRTHALTTPDMPIGKGLLDAVRALSPSQLETRRQQSRSELWQADASHPPTALRVDMLARHATYQPVAVLTMQEHLALGQEIDQLIAAMQRALVNRHLASIYG